MSDAGSPVTELPDTERDNRDDASLVAESLDSPERFASLFDRHAPAIHRYIARRLGPDAADDLVAETFLIAFQRRRGNRDGLKFPAGTVFRALAVLRAAITNTAPAGPFDVQTPVVAGPGYWH